MTEHSKLMSPSSSHVWIPCTAMPQALIDDGYVDKSGPEALRGTLQHDAAEHWHKGELQDVCPLRLDPEEWDQVKVSVKAMTDFLEKDGSGGGTFKDFFEITVRFKGWRKECFGTVDFLRLDVTNRTLYVFDHKFGRVAVSSWMNSQILIYATAAIEQFTEQGFDMRGKIDRVILGVAQPKVRKKLSAHEFTMEQVVEWETNVLIPAQQAIVEGRGRFLTGAHCRDHYCKRASTCEVLNAKASAAMDQFMEEYQRPETSILKMTPQQLSERLADFPVVELVIKKIREAAFNTLDNGVEVPNYKLVNGKGKNAWKDESSELSGKEFLIDRGIELDKVAPRKTVTGPQALKLLKKKEEEEQLKEYIEFKHGKPTLVHETDERPALVPATRREAAEAEAESAIDEMLGGVEAPTKDWIDDL